MPRTFMALRSVLYVPGSNTRAIEKAKSLPADALIFDLEDAVAPSAKEEARTRVCATVREGSFGKRQIAVRTNPLATHWGYDDLVAVAQCGANAVLLPKVESSDIVRQSEMILAGAGAPPAMETWCMLETPRGMLNSASIAVASSRIRALVMGTSDLAKDLGAVHTRERLPFLTSLSLCILAARAADVAILDGVYLNLADDEGFQYQCRQGLEMGFDGKTLIHPKSIELANQTFSPSEQEVDWARRVIDAHREAIARGEGVVVLDGKLIENLHVESARRTLLLAKAIHELEMDANGVPAS